MRRARHRLRIRFAAALGGAHDVLALVAHFDHSLLEPRGLSGAIEGGAPECVTPGAHLVPQGHFRFIEIDIGHGVLLWAPAVRFAAIFVRDYEIGGMVSGAVASPSAGSILLADRIAEVCSQTLRLAALAWSM